MRIQEKYLEDKSAENFTKIAANKTNRLKIVLGKTSMLLLASFFIFACSKNKLLPSISSNSDSAVVLNTYLALGDSYTIGQSVDSAMRYPAQAAALLALQSNIRFSGISYIAATGWSTYTLKNAIKATVLHPPYSAVTLLIGVNDQNFGYGLDEYKKNFNELLDTAISLAGNIKAHVFVLSIPDYSVTPFGGNDKIVAKEINTFNATNKSITAKRGIAYIDVTAISRRNSNDTTMLSPDKLHPSGKQYEQWAQPLAQRMAIGLK